MQHADVRHPAFDQHGSSRLPTDLAWDAGEKEGEETVRAYALAGETARTSRNCSSLAVEKKEVLNAAALPLETLMSEALHA